jgi:hypothetical protein
MNRNRTYRAAAGARTTLWLVGDVGHTAWLRTHPKECEPRTVGVLDRAL